MTTEERVSLHCECDLWSEILREQIDLNQMALIHGLSLPNTLWRYCPMCGEKLVEKPSNQILKRAAKNAADQDRVLHQEESHD